MIVEFVFGKTTDGSPDSFEVELSPAQAAHCRAVAASEGLCLEKWVIRCLKTVLSASGDESKAGIGEREACVGFLSTGRMGDVSRRPIARHSADGTHDFPP